MDDRVTPLTRKPDATPPPRAGSRWVGVLLAAAGIAFGYVLGQAATGGDPSQDTKTEVDTSAVAEPASAAGSELLGQEDTTFPGTILASVEFGRGLVTWPGDGDPLEVRLASDVEAAGYDAARRRIAVTLPEYGDDTLALHVGTVGDLRFVASGVTGFAWHPTDPSAIAWVVERGDGFMLMKAVVSDDRIRATHVTTLPNRVRPIAWGSWGFALQGHDQLTTIAPSGTVIAGDDLQLVAAGSDGRLVVARPAGTPLSSDWAITGPELANQQPLGRFEDLDDHPTAAAILPRSGRIVLVSNRFGDGDELARIEILSADGTRRTVIRSGMIAESIAWSPDETRLAIGGYYYGPTRVRSVVLLTASDGTEEPIEVPFDHQVHPLGLRG